MQIYSWIFSKHFHNNFSSDNCGRPLSYIGFHILRNSRLQNKVILQFLQSSQENTCDGVSF